MVPDVDVATIREVEADAPRRPVEVGEVGHTARTFMQNKEPLTPGEEGLRDLTIIEAVYEAAKNGKTVKLA